MSTLSRPQAWKSASLIIHSNYEKRLSRSFSSAKDKNLELVRNVGIMAVRKQGQKS
jgi:hypothetical protein